MTQSACPELPPPLADAWLRIEHWRGNKEGRRMPEELWCEAADLAVEFGVYRTSRTLRLNYASLKERVDPDANLVTRDLDASPLPPPADRPAFVDLVPSVSVSHAAGEGAVEMIATDGAMMRIEWSGGSSPDMASVVGAFFRSAS